MSVESEYDLVIFGAGPAGITAAIEGQKYCRRILLLEKDEVVGGISRTHTVDGFRFDLGGHRFFTKVERVFEFWTQVISDKDFLRRPRKSRILYNGKFFDYPLKPINALKNLGLIESLHCIISYFRAQSLSLLGRKSHQESFEDWVSARFGYRLYSIFFKTYTEKVWGISAQKLSADWAAQRIKNLSLSRAVVNAFGFRNKKITTLIEEFWYPRLGPGMLWESALRKFVDNGGIFMLRSFPEHVNLMDGVYTIRLNDGSLVSSKRIISSIPLKEIPSLLKNLGVAPSNAASKLKYRDFLVVGLAFKGLPTFDDNWVYVHDSSVKVGRVQNFSAWSPDMVPPNLSFLGMEYFANTEEEFYNKSDCDLIQIALDEIVKIGLANKSHFIKGYVVRVPKAYPVYDSDYRNAVQEIQNWLSANFPNFLQVGRNGQHRYNNQDHSMMTSLLSIDNLFLGHTNDIWNVNVDDEYHEETFNSGRDAPMISN